MSTTECEGLSLNRQSDIPATAVTSCNVLAESSGEDPSAASCLDRQRHLLANLKVVILHKKPRQDDLLASTKLSGGAERTVLELQKLLAAHGFIIPCRNPVLKELR